jgi:hypothetical protein
MDPDWILIQMGQWGSRQAKIVLSKRNFIFEEFSVGLEISPRA